MSLKQMIAEFSNVERVDTAKTLARFFDVQKLDFTVVDQEELIQSTAHVIVDVQRKFADPTYISPKSVRSDGNSRTDKVAERISVIAPQFREVGFKTYWIYSTENEEKNPENCYGGFHKNTPTPEDELVSKNSASAFRGSNLKERLILATKKRILVSGFNAGACVQQTVLDGTLGGFQVCVFSDAVENDRHHSMPKRKNLKAMQCGGAVVCESGAFLKQFKL